MIELGIRLLGLGLAAVVGVRWLRVAQREHYLAGRCFWAYRLWVRHHRTDVVLLALAAGAFAFGLGTGEPLVLAAAAVLGLAAPLRLGLRGRTSKLAWTPRLRRVAVLALVLEAVVVLLAPRPLAVLAVALPALVVDLALAVLRPVEKKLSAKFLVQARARMRQISPTVVAITGSYGKTTTKQYLAHLLADQRAVVPSPASFNNAMGLSRAVNEHLLPGTDVFIAEMGTYGKGEIRDLCELFPPDIALITAIGEVHLERMRSLDGILEAKSEIVEKAQTAVLNLDDPRLAALAERLRAQGRRVIGVSAREVTADVALVPAGGALRLHVSGSDLGEVTLPASAHASNAAMALGAAVAAGIDAALLTSRLAALPSVAHRMEAAPTQAGGWVLDDTYNSNPAGAAAALSRAAALATQTGGALHVVTPGMVEMGGVQDTRNAEFGTAIGHAGARSLTVVGRTNRAALMRGFAAAAGEGEVQSAPTRDAAMALLTPRMAAGDVVLFENDLPDHYP